MKPVLRFALVTLIFTVLSGNSMADDIAVTYSPSTVYMCQSSGQTVHVAMSAVILNYPTPDAECELDYNFTWSWTGCVGNGSTASVPVTDSAPGPSGTVSASCGETVGDHFDPNVANCDGTKGVSGNWQTSVVPTHLNATWIDAPTDLSAGCSNLYIFMVHVDAMTPPYSWTYNCTGATVDHTWANGDTGNSDAAVYISANGAQPGPGSVTATVTDTRGCSKTIVTNFYVHGSSPEIDEDPDSPLSNQETAKQLVSTLVGGGPNGADWTFSVSAGVSLSLTASIDAEAAVLNWLKLNLGFSTTATANITAGETCAVHIPANELWGLYGYFEYDHHFGTATTWDCSGNPTTVDWSADQNPRPALVPLPQQ